MTSLTAGSLISFWGFDALQRIALSTTFETASFHKLDEYDYINGMAVESGQAYVFLLTSENFQRVKPILKAMQKTGVHVVLVSNVSSLSYFWLKASKTPAWISLVRDDQDVVKNLIEATSTQGPIDRFTSSDLLWKTAFTERQLMILKGLIHGDTNKKIAESVFQSEKTVEVEIKNICAILEISQKKTEQNIRVLIGQRYAQLVGVL